MSGRISLNRNSNIEPCSTVLETDANYSEKTLLGITIVFLTGFIFLKASNETAIRDPIRNRLMQGRLLDTQESPAGAYSS